MLAFLALSFPLHAQMSELAAREAALKKLSGTELVSEALALSRDYYSAREIGKSQKAAKTAYDAALKIKDQRSMSLALNQQAKAMIAEPGLSNLDRGRIVKKLEESNALSSDAALREENLKMMRQLYVHMGKNKEVMEVDKALEIMAAGEKNAQLEQRLAVIGEEREQLSQIQSDLKKSLDLREKAIKYMTESQAKTELMIAQQKSILDSLSFLKMLDSLKISQRDLELEQQNILLREREAQLGQRKAERNLIFALAALALVFAAAMLLRFFHIRRYNRDLQKKNEEIAAEKQRSDELLLNILPAEVAHELKTNGKAKAKFFESASVLFVDFEAFSQFAAGLPPEELVETLHHCFQQFDRIVERHGLEKIKTIGDAYMAAGGLPMPDATNAKQAVRAALDIKTFLDTWKLEREAAGKPFLRARIGIHTGPLVAGVVGEKKFAYDIWGDTVNLASRMESSGESGKVNISAATYNFVKNDFECRHRGKVPAKNLGEVDMYFVEKMI
jgi:adenylate cyclase